ncbi:MAG: DNA topoisomerase III [Verrucomicrobiales bacterium]
MGKTLIIAEKPSVATDLSRALAKEPGIGKFQKDKDFFESESTIISSAIGHLVELGMPMQGAKKLPWKFDVLPHMPDKFDLQPIDKTKSRLNLLIRLMKRKDVDLIVNACDAGREGELIFRYVMDFAGIKKPIKRMWMQSMTQGSILDAWRHLRDGSEMMPLADAAVCRSESDWLVGLNGTRALTAFNSRHGGFNKTPVGRVQTPTLTILVKREKEIQSFVPRDYWEVHGTFGIAAGSYLGRWFDQNWKKDETDPHNRPERLWDRAKAEAIKARCEGKTGVIEEEKKPSKQAPPLLYDLTSLQREASGRFGFSARRTLQLAQALYEKHKVLTYPRTDSRYLPEDYIGNVKAALSGFSDLTDAGLGSFPANLRDYAGEALKRVGPNRRIFDNSKVSDHFAIIPTGQVPKGLDEAEAKLFDMVARRFVAVFFPAAEWELTRRITRIGEDAFRTDGKVLRVPGWLAVYGKQAQDEAAGEGGGKVLAPAEPGEPAKTERIEVKDETTKPPPHYNEATLLSAMEGAGKLVDDDELREAMSERGLGTPATRAAIIEGLILDNYVARGGRELVATQKGIALIDQIEEIGIDALTSPEMTGDWEYKLKQMEHGKLARNEFMREIRSMTTRVVDRTKAFANHQAARVFPDFDATCPACGTRPLKQDDSSYSCANPECAFRMYKNLAGRMFTEAEAKALVGGRVLENLTGFRSKFGKDFDAGVELTKDEKGKWKLGFIFPEDEAAKEALENLSSDMAVCECPLCKSQGRGDQKIYQTETHYACRKNLEGKKCKAKLSRELCKVEIPREQARKFFLEGKTDMIDKFISKKGRPFSAELLFDPDGKRGVMNWKFPPRAPKKKAAAKA